MVTAPSPPRTFPRAGAARTLAAALVAALLAPALAVAQTGATINVSVDPQVIQLGQSATFRIDVNVDGNLPVQIGSPPTGDYRIGMSGTMSSRSNINGVVVSQTTRTYRITPTRTGRIEVGMVPVRIGGVMEHSDPVYLDVIAAGAPTPPAAGPTPGRQVVIPGAPAAPQGGADRARPEPAVPENAEGHRPFITTVASSETVWLGEPFVVDYEAYTPRRDRWQMVGIDQPSFSNLWFHDVDVERVRDYRGHRATVGTIPFEGHLISRYVMVPLEPGTLELPGVRADFNSYRYGRSDTESPPFRVEVRPLPDGAPRGFQRSNVGQYTFSMTAVPSGTRVGDAIRVTMRAEGTGLTDLLVLPEPPVTGAASVQAPVDESRQELLGETSVGGFKQVEWVILPTAEGELTIGPVAFHYFDPALGRYQTIDVPAQTFTISGFSPTADLLRPAVAEERQSELLSALSSRREAAPAPARRQIPEPLFWALLIVPPLAWAGSGAAGRLRKRRAEGEPERVRRSAASSAMSAVRAARKGGDGAPSGIAAALRRYLAERLDLRAGALTLVELGRALRDRGVPGETATELVDLLDACQSAAYGGASAAHEPEALATRALAVIEALERHA